MAKELIQSKKIEELTKIIEKVKLNSKQHNYEKEKNTYYTDYKYPVLKDPYCSVATSLARLISYDQVCGCLYIDTKSKESVNVSFSTNYHPDDMSNVNKRRFERDRFERSIKPRLKSLVDKNFRYEERLKLFQVAFDSMISETAKRFQPIINGVIRKSKENGINQETKIAELLNNEIYLKSNWNDKSLANIKSIIEKINHFLKTFDYSSENPYNNNLYISVMKIAIILNDIENLCNLDKGGDNHNEIIRKVILKDEIKRANCRGKFGILHCEQRMLEHISNKH